MVPQPNLVHYSGRHYYAAEHTPLYVQQSLVGNAVSAHDHDFLEVALILEGHGRHLSVQGEQTLQTGDALILRPGAWHAYRDCANLRVFNCCFSMALLDRELAILTQDPALHYLFWEGPLSRDRQGVMTLRLPPPVLQACCRHLDGIAQAQVEGGEAAATTRWLDQIGHLLLLLGQLSRCMLEDGRANDSRRLHPAITRCRQMLEQEPARDWTLALLAGELYLDASYLVRLFRAGMGMPPMAYLTRVRMERAASLLLQTSLPVGEIGAQVGICDASYFARRFRACFRLTASDYRARFVRASASSVTGTDNNTAS